VEEQNVPITHGGLSADLEPWQMGLTALTALGLAPGTRVSTRWLYKAMGIPFRAIRQPGESDNEFATRAASWALNRFQPQVALLQAHLLRTEGFYMRSIGAGPNRPGEWELLDASAALDVASRAVKDVRKSLRKATGVISNLRTTGLTSQQISEKDDAAARLAHLQGLMKMK